MFNFFDMGSLRKKISGSEDNKNFRYTKGFCKHYGNKVVDGACIVAGGLCIIVPLILGVFFGDSEDEKRGNNHNGKTRKH